VTGYPPGLIEKVSSIRPIVTMDCWISKNRPQKISTKPMSTPGAADEMKALAEKLGWTHVATTPIVKPR
jgi:hypothetical protein